MSENKETSGDSQEQAAPAFAVAVQYLKALSIDNSGAPASFRSDKPDNAAESKSDVKVDVQITETGDDKEHYEVQTLIEIISKNAKDETRFILRASYAAITLVRNIGEEDKQMLLNVETPRLTFPYLRSIVSQITHESGYPALNLAPIDFRAVYNQKQQRAEAQKKTDQ
jgi:preprotein translocase subunit SecB